MRAVSCEDSELFVEVNWDVGSGCEPNFRIGCLW
jgi:hypothetical protein